MKKNPLFPEPGLFFDVLVLARLEKKNGATELAIFGSRARGDNDFGSDVDVASDGSGVDGFWTGPRSGVDFEVYPASSTGESFLDPSYPHRAIKLTKDKS